jgi:hypothetical protein
LADCAPVKAFILLAATQAPFGLAFAKEFPPEVEARHRAQVAEERKALEEAPSRPAAEVMPKLVRSAALDGTYPDELRLGFNRIEVALAAIKKVAGYEGWFRNRLAELIPPGAVERDTIRGRRRMVAIPEGKGGETRTEHYLLFTALERLATDEAVRILADYLWDDRLIYPPGDDYGSSTLAEFAVSSLAEMRRYRELIGSPRTVEPATWREWWTANKASYAPRSK